MDVVNKRPAFTQEQIAEELKQVGLVDRILARHGALTLRQLHSIISKIDEVMFLAQIFVS